MHKTNVEVASVKESNSNYDPAPCTIGKDESEGRLLAVTEMLSVLRRDIQGLKVFIENHIKTSQIQISQIKDKIVSVKNNVLS